MHKLYELKDKLIEELEDYSQNGKYSKEDVEIIKYMASAVDHLCNIVERADDEEYSMNMGGSYDGGSYNMGDGSYARGGRGGYNRGGGSYARGRGRNAQRDSRGRYSGEAGYSRDAKELADELRDMIRDVSDERTRQKLQRFVGKIEDME